MVRKGYGQGAGYRECVREVRKGGGEREGAREGRKGSKGREGVEREKRREDEQNR